MSTQAHGGMPTEDQIIFALAKAFDATESAAIVWLQGIHVHFDAKAAHERVAERHEADSRLLQWDRGVRAAMREVRK